MRKVKWILQSPNHPKLKKRFVEIWCELPGLDLCQLWMIPTRCLNDDVMRAIERAYHMGTLETIKRTRHFLSSEETQKTEWEDERNTKKKGGWYGVE